MDVKELYLSSVKELKRLIKENKEITSEEWNDFIIVYNINFKSKC